MNMGDTKSLISMPSTYSLVLVGVGGVGKSCITIQYISHKFVDEYDPTLEDSYRKVLTIDNDECVLDIFDTAGQEDFSAVRDQYMRNGNGFFCVYSINSRESFGEAQILYEHIKRVKDDDNIPIVLVGNKCDLEEDREVTFDEGLSLSKELNCPFIETSAKSGYNVYMAFELLVKEIKKYRNSNKHETELTEEPSKTDKDKKKKKKCNIL